MTDFEKIVVHARDVVDRLGVEQRDICCGWCGILCKVYEDDVLKITVTLVDGKGRLKTDPAGLLEIVRKENDNPCIMATADNRYIRSHGEFNYIKEHFFGL